MWYLFQIAIFCVVAVFKSNQLTTAVTQNTCLYSADTDFVGTIILSIHVTTLESCCVLCKGLSNCIGWSTISSSTTGARTCNLYSEITELKRITSSGLNRLYYFSGWKTSTPFWQCNAKSNIWYYDPVMAWGLRTDIRTQDNCCADSLFAPWKSWMFNNKTSECWHSQQVFTTSTASFSFDGMNSGHPQLNFQMGL